MKVVDLVFLYNYYFGQISCSHMKFLVLDGQKQLKFFEMVTVPPRFCQCIAGLDVGASTRRRADVRAPT